MGGTRVIKKIHEDAYKITLDGDLERNDCQIRIDPDKNWQGSKESFGSLTKRFFDYYNDKFKKNGQVFFSLDPEEKLKFQTSIFHVSDHLDPNNNVAINMSSQNFTEFKKKFKKAQTEFRNEEYIFH